MFIEIIELYEKQLEKYREISQKLTLFDNLDEIDIEKYDAELQNISLNLEIIDKVGSRIEQLKEIYILKNNITDFTSSEIKTIESEDNFNKFMNTVTNVSEEIKRIKKLQDKIISKLNTQLNKVTTLLNESEYGKKMAEIYKKKNKQNYSIDVKK